MTAMFDASCSKCGRRYGWTGEIKDHPPCPRCGYRQPQEQIDHDAAELEKFRQMLRARGQGDCKMRRDQRVAAGLTLRQAAKILGIFPADLSDYENGRAEPSPDLRKSMAKAYGCYPEESNELPE